MALSDTDQLHLDPPESISGELKVEGVIPEALRGTLLRNGPGIQSAGTDRLHLLDGYGFVVAASFEGGHATLLGNHVDTPIKEKERAAGRQLARRPFTNKPGRWRNVLDVSLPSGANHDVVAFGGRVVATDSPGWFALDGNTLRTEGPSPVDALKAGKLGTLCQMPRIDPASGRLVVFTVKPGVGADEVVFHELDSQWKPVATRKASLGTAGVLLHDLAFTEKHYVALEIGKLSLGGAMWGASTVFDAIGTRGDGSRGIYVVSRQGTGPARRISLPKGQQAFHVFNAFEDGENLVIDVVAYEHRVDFKPLGAPGARGEGPVDTQVPRAMRCVVRPGAMTAEIRSYDAVGDSPSVNPEFHGRRTRFGYFAAKTKSGDEHAPGAYFYFHGIGRLDFETGEVTTWSAGPRAFCSAPAFAPRVGATAEDDGWLLTWIHDASTQKASIAVFDARRLSEGPVARVHLSCGLPAVSHNRFTPEVLVRA